MLGEIPPSMAILWLHFSFVGLATAFYARQHGLSISVSLALATLIASAMFVLNSSLSAMFIGLLDEKVNRSAISNLVKGLASVVYLFPFVISQVAFAPISCITTILSMKVFRLFRSMQIDEGKTQFGALRFDVSFLFFVTAIVAIGFTQLLAFVRNKSF